MRALLIAMLLTGTAIHAKTLKVGPKQRYRRIEDAVAKAAKGDTILVYPQAGNKPYEKPVVFIDKPGLTISGVLGKNGERVKLSGKGFNYSGRGRIPRGIFQFSPGADGCTLENFELFGASSESHNGAGVRIAGANHVTIRNCEIRNNDMGIMSNGKLMKGGINQVIEHCILHHNGNFKEAGYNHNLYLGGTSVTLRFCEVYSSLTGHNVKSRAHFNRIEYSYIHHSANREFDLVDSAETAAPKSHAVLIGNVIVKDPNCKGNRTVIHFGQDGGKQHDGTLYLIHNTIITPFVSPVVDLSASKTKAMFIGNLIDSGGSKQNSQVLSKLRNGANAANVEGSTNWFSAGFTNGVPKGSRNKHGKRGRYTSFKDPANHDYRLKKRTTGISAAGQDPSKLELPKTPGSKETTKPLLWQYLHPASKEKRPAKTRKATLGAY